MFDFSECLFSYFFFALWKYENKFKYSFDCIYGYHRLLCRGKCFTPLSFRLSERSSKCISRIQVAIQWQVRSTTFTSILRCTWGISCPSTSSFACLAESRRNSCQPARRYRFLPSNPVVRASLSWFVETQVIFIKFTLVWWIMCSSINYKYGRRQLIYKYFCQRCMWFFCYVMNIDKCTFIFKMFIYIYWLLFNIYKPRLALFCNKII